MNKKLISRALIQVIDRVKAAFCFNSARTPLVAPEGRIQSKFIFIVNMPNYIRYIIYQTKALDTRETKKLVVVIFDTFLLSKITYCLNLSLINYQTQSYHFYLFFQPKNFTNTSPMTAITIKKQLAYIILVNYYNSIIYIVNVDIFI